jgi:LysM repeat protein
LQAELESVRAAYASRATNAYASPDAVSHPAKPVRIPDTPTVSQASATQPQTSTLAAANSTGTRTHKVQSGETPFSIARKYRINVETLLSANPGLNPRRMQIGQMLNLPAL